MGGGASILRNNAALRAAADSGNEAEVVSLLLKKKANVACVDEVGTRRFARAHTTPPSIPCPLRARIAPALVARVSVAEIRRITITHWVACPLSRAGPHYTSRPPRAMPPLSRRSFTTAPTQTPMMRSKMLPIATPCLIRFDRFVCSMCGAG